MRNRNPSKYAVQAVSLWVWSRRRSRPSSRGFRSRGRGREWGNSDKSQGNVEIREEYSRGRRWLMITASKELARLILTSANIMITFRELFSQYSLYLIIELSSEKCKMH